MAADQANEKNTATGKPERASEIPRTRSPNFPVFSLRKAIEKLDPLYKAAKKYQVSAVTALKHLGHSSTTSSNALQTVGALRGFGLIEGEGTGDARQYRVTDAGAQIAGGHPDRPALLKKAALLPPLFKDVWELQTADGLPPDEVIRNHLLWNLKFNENSIPVFIASFRDTLAFAGLTADDKVSEETKVTTDGGGRNLWESVAPPVVQRPFKVGDFVQWTSDGVDQFTEPRPIKGFHDAGHAYFDKDGKGIAPVSELTIMDPRVPTTPTPVAVATPAATPAVAFSAGDQVMIVEERFTLDEGPVIVRWPSKLSADSYYDLEHHMKGLLARARRKAGIKPKEAGE